jgi:putative heme-binding domain-containing protein
MVNRQPMKKGVLARVIFLLTFLILASCSKDADDDGKYSGEKFRENIRSTEARTPDAELAGFKVPPGFEIQLFASEPNIDKPINLAFDARGRMWVTSSFEYPFPSSSTPHGSDRITILEDTDHDGRADKFTDVVDTVNIPIGILPLNSSAITFSIPNLYTYQDANGDGKLDQQRVLFGPFGYQDTHGMVSNFMRGYDGWVHACHGFTNRSTVAGSDGDSIRMVSGNTFRFRLDGSRVEQMTFGQVNPFGLVFDAYGYVYSTDSHSSPLYQLIRGADYPHFGKLPVMAFAPDMKPLENEATALCGISQYADVKFPPEFRGNFFIGDVVNCRVHRYSYVFNGSSPVGKSEVDFIKSEDPWFRPVNIKMGPDGAIYVADFYNAIIGHYEVPLGHPKRDKSRGRIWRITYKGDQNKPIDFTTLSLDDLLGALDHENLSMRMTAADQVADRIGEEAIAPLQAALQDQKTSARKYVHSLWLLHRLNALSTDVLKKASAHADPLVRLHTMRVLTEQKPAKNYYDIAVQSLSDSDPHVRRAATELIMKYPAIQSVKAVLALQRDVPKNDSHLIYTTQLCLRNMLRNEPLLKEVVGMPWSDSDAAAIAFVMVDIPLPSAAEFLAAYAGHHPMSKERLATAYGRITRFIPAFKLEAVFSTAMKMYGDDVDQRALIFQGFQEGMAQRGKSMEGKAFRDAASGICAELVKTYPPGTRMKSDESIALQRFAVTLAGDYAINSLEPALKSYLKSSTTNVDVRTASLRSLLRMAPSANMTLVDEMLNDDSATLDLKKRVVTVAGEYPGNSLNKVLSEVKHAPSDVQIAIVLALSASADGKDLVFKKVRSGELNARTLLDPKVEERLQMNISKKQRAEFVNLTANLDPIDNERQVLIDERLKAFKEVRLASLSLDSGSNVFSRNCSVCHRRISQVGTGIGPQLHGIGKRGEAALAEKILDPNRNISEAFRSYTIRLKDGTLLTGLLRREEGEVLVFADFAGKEFFVPKKNIVEQKASRFSVMPDNFGTTLSQDEFNALLAYLLSS